MSNTHHCLQRGMVMCTRRTGPCIRRRVTILASQSPPRIGQTTTLYGDCLGASRRSLERNSRTPQTNGPDPRGSRLREPPCIHVRRHVAHSPPICARNSRLRTSPAAGISMGMTASASRSTTGRSARGARQLEQTPAASAIRLDATAGRRRARTLARAAYPAGAPTSIVWPAMAVSSSAQWKR